jgi:Mg2+ and Co2+ transporter CorA
MDYSAAQPGFHPWNARFSREISRTFPFVTEQERNKQSADSTKRKASRRDSTAAQARSVDKGLVEVKESEESGHRKYATQLISLEGLSKEKKLQRIKEEVWRLLEARNAGGSTFTDDAEEELNTKWQKEKSEFNWKWLDTLFAKERVLRDTEREYAEKNQKREECAGEIDRLKQEIDRLQRKKTLLKERLEKLHDWQESLNKNFFNRLADIPMSICLLGRVPQGTTDNPDSLRKLVTSTLIKEAIKRVKGSKVSDLAIVKNDSLIRKTVVSVQGRGNVVDFFSVARSPRPTGRAIEFIARVEVYPFDERSSSKDRMSILDESLLGKVSVESFDANAEGESSRKDSLNEAQKRFVRAQIQVANISNMRVESQTQELLKERDLQTGKIDTLLAAIEADLSKVNLQIEEREKERDRMIIVHDGLQKEILSFSEELSKARKDYQRFTLNKENFVNKSEQKQMQGVVSEDFGTMVENTYSVINDLRLIDSRTRVLVTTSGVPSETQRKTRAEDLSYIPEIIGFQVLYLGEREISSQNHGVLNIAYRVRWSPELTKLTIGKDTLVDRQNRKFWIRKKELSSVNYAKEGMPDGFRLPTFAELETLDKTIQRHRELNDFHPFTKLKWEMDYPYVTVDEAKGEKNHGAYRCYDFLKQIVDLIQPEEAAYVLWVKEIIKSDE